MKLDNNMNLELQGNEITLRKTEALEGKAGSVLKKLDAVYDEFARLLFLFDVSASMMDRVAVAKDGKTLVNQFLWTDALLAAIRSDTLAALNRLDQGCGQGNDDLYAKLADKQLGQNGEFLFTPVDDNDLKERIVRADLLVFLGIKPDFNQKHQQPPTRIELVRKLAKQEIKARFQKFPNSQVSVVPFSGHPVTLFDAQDPDNLWPALDTLNYPWRVTLCSKCGYTGNPNAEDRCPKCSGTMYNDGSDGGTDILSAIRCAIELCRKRPSPVGIHHIIVVTDGEDYNADTTIQSWVSALKQSGVVLDYIHIGDRAANAGLKAACEALGGEYVTVNCERDFEEKFIAAVNRLMLPPAPAV